MKRKSAEAKELWIGYDFDGVVVVGEPLAGTACYIRAKEARDTCLDVLPKVTGEALYYVFLDTLRARWSPAGAFQGREWYEVDTLSKAGWEKVAAEVKTKYEKPTLTQLRLETKVAEAALKWWKVEEWLSKNDIEKFEETDDYSSAFANFIVQLMKEK